MHWTFFRFVTAPEVHAFKSPTFPLMVSCYPFNGVIRPAVKQGPPCLLIL